MEKTSKEDAVLGCDAITHSTELAATEVESASDLADLKNSGLTDDEKIDIAAAGILERYRRAFEELAK